MFQCNLLNPSKKLSGNLVAGNERLVSPVYIIWKGNISPPKVLANVSVIAHVSSAHCFDICLEFFSAMVTLEVGIYFDGV